MMTGQDFRNIRRANKISIRKICLATSKSDFTIRHYERSNYVPSLYVNALGEIIKQDLTNPTRVEKILEEIPEELKNKRKRNCDIFNVRFNF